MIKKVFKIKAVFTNFFLVVISLSLLPSVVSGINYEIPLSTSTVDGTTFCGGTACDSGDILIILGGTRDHLTFKNLDGAGQYITIKNDSTALVNFVKQSRNGYGTIVLDDCKYVDLRGNNNANYTYGIKVENIYDSSCGVRIMGQSDHIKFSYMEITQEGTPVESGSGFFIQDGTESNTWTWDDIEIHHNHIHDTQYAGMYLGQNQPWNHDSPYLANIHVHNNILKNMGSYGITVKGSKDGTHLIHHNIVDTTRTNPHDTGLGSSGPWGYKGIGFQHFSGTAVAKVYNNTIIRADGTGIQIGEHFNAQSAVYDNNIFDCGLNVAGYTASRHTSGISAMYDSDALIEDNIVLNSNAGGRTGTWYGIHVGNTSYAAEVNRNKIGGLTTDAVSIPMGANFIEGTGTDANIAYTDIADFNFCKWLDDGDYSNDDFNTKNCSTTIKADVDQQNGINSTDAMLTLRNSLSLDMSQTAWQESATTGDVNCDGTSNSTDAMLILRHSVGLSMSGTGWCE